MDRSQRSADLACRYCEWRTGPTMWTIGEARASRDGADPVDPPGTGRRWQERLGNRPQLVRGKLLYKSGHGAGPSHPTRKGGNDVSACWQQQEELDRLITATSPR